MFTLSWAFIIEKLSYDIFIICYWGYILYVDNIYEIRYADTNKKQISIQLTIYSCPPNIPNTDSNPGLDDTFKEGHIARSYPNSTW